MAKNLKFAKVFAMTGLQAFQDSLEAHDSFPTNLVFRDKFSKFIAGDLFAYPSGYGSRFTNILAYDNELKEPAFLALTVDGDEIVMQSVPSLSYVDSSADLTGTVTWIDWYDGDNGIANNFDAGTDTSYDTVLDTTTITATESATISSITLRYPTR